MQKAAAGRFLVGGSLMLPVSYRALAARLSHHPELETPNMATQERPNRPRFTTSTEPSRLAVSRRALVGGLLLIALGPGLNAPAGAEVGIDHEHASWSALLARHVQWSADGKSSTVRYVGLQKDRAALKGVLDSYSTVTPQAFATFTREQQIAFLVNAYNAFTVELILTRYPDLKSIKDIGSIVQSPWKRKFFTLLGDQRNLDWIEHDQLRPKYNEPRIHTAVNCASIGCPALRPEAFTASKLELQLEDGMQRFMGDRSRNRFVDGRMEVSSIFKWFREDFEKGHRGWSKLDDVFDRYAPLLAASADQVATIRAGKLPIRFLDYDWSLNDAAR